MCRFSVVLGLILVVACGDSTDPGNQNGNGNTFGPDDLAGTWQAISFNGDTVPGRVTVLNSAGAEKVITLQAFTIVLNADGTGTWHFDNSRGAPVLATTWSITTGENFDITITESFMTGFTMTGAHDNGVLMIVDEDGNTSVFQ